MTGNSRLISRQNCVYVTYSGTGDQTAHRSDKIVKTVHFVKLVVPVLDPRALKPQFWHLSSGKCWMTGTSNLISRHSWIYVTSSDRGDQTAHGYDNMAKISFWAVDNSTISLQKPWKPHFLHLSHFLTQLDFCDILFWRWSNNTHQY